MNLYFAYGSNMSQEQMNQRGPGAEIISAATLQGCRFLINERGVATLLPNPDSLTPGVLWRISAEHEKSLDRFEGCAQGIYDKCYREIITPDGGTARALVYIDHNNQQFGAPRDGYMERIIEGAVEHELPEAHVQMLSAWPVQGFRKAFNRLMNDLKVNTPGGLGADVVRALKQERDKLLLAAVDRLVRYRAKAEVYDIMLDMVLMDRADELILEYELEEVEMESQRLLSLKRLHAHIELMLRTRNYQDALRTAPEDAELASLGIIITNDPNRPHDEDDRVIVTRHAPMLAVVWGLAANLDGSESEAWAFLPHFADAIERYLQNDDIIELCEEGLRATQEELKARIGEMVSPHFDYDIE